MGLPEKGSFGSKGEEKKLPPEGKSTRQNFHVLVIQRFSKQEGFEHWYEIDNRNSALEWENWQEIREFGNAFFETQNTAFYQNF